MAKSLTLYPYMHAYALSHTHSSVQVYLTVKIYMKSSFDSIEKFGIFRVGSGAGVVSFFVVWVGEVDLILRRRWKLFKVSHKLCVTNFFKVSQEVIRKKVVNPQGEVTPQNSNLLISS